MLIPSPQAGQAEPWVGPARARLTARTRGPVPGPARLSKVAGQSSQLIVVPWTLTRSGDGGLKLRLLTQKAH